MSYDKADGKKSPDASRGGKKEDQTRDWGRRTPVAESSKPSGSSNRSGSGHRQAAPSRSEGSWRAPLSSGPSRTTSMEGSWRKTTVEAAMPSKAEEIRKPAVERLPVPVAPVVMPAPVDLVPYTGEVGPYASPTTLDAMRNIGNAPFDKPASPLKDMTGMERIGWRNRFIARQKEEDGAPGRDGEGGAKRAIQSYALIHGYDPDEVEPKVLLARKSIFNKWTTRDGVRQSQDVEMRAPGQLGLPGGASRALAPYGLATDRRPADGPAEEGLTRLAVESGADEALAETGIDVRSKAFSPSVHTAYAHESGERTHAAFSYQGSISELAKSANQVLRANGTADNEVSELIAVKLSEAYEMMQAAQQAGLTGASGGSQDAMHRRLHGDGIDWHHAPLLALRELVASQGRPETLVKLSDHPDAIKWIGGGVERPPHLTPP